MSIHLFAHAFNAQLFRIEVHLLSVLYPISISPISAPSRYRESFWVETKRKGLERTECQLQTALLRAVSW